MKIIGLIFILALSVMPVKSQTQSMFQCETPLPCDTYKQTLPFSHLDASLTVGSTGLGSDVASPVNDFLQLRMGLSFMPRFHAIVNFPIKGMVKDSDGSWAESKLDRMTDLLYSFSGYKAEDNVDMKGRPTYYNFKFLVDVFPFKNKKWHLTAGFFYGNSKVAEAINVTEDMPSLFAVGMYNNFYNRFETGYFYDNAIYDNIYLDPEMVILLEEGFMRYGRMGIHVGDYARDMDPLYYQEEVYDDYGNLIHLIGEPMLDEDGKQMYKHYKGDPYLMEPNEESMVKAKMHANKFKPYLGFGYGTDIDKSKNGWAVSFDAGVMFWGGSPSLIAHDGIDIVNDLVNVRGKVGTYSNLIEKMKVFPVLEVRVSKRIF